MTDKNYKIQGFLKERREREKQTVSAKDLTYTFEGLNLSEIQIQACIKSAIELDHFIKFLEMSRPCFNKML